MTLRMKKYAAKYTTDDYRNILHISVGYKISSKALVSDIAKRMPKWRKPAWLRHPIPQIWLVRKKTYSNGTDVEETVTTKYDICGISWYLYHNQILIMKIKYIINIPQVWLSNLIYGMH